VSIFKVEHDRFGGSGTALELRPWVPLPAHKPRTNPKENITQAFTEVLSAKIKLRVRNAKMTKVVGGR
jgi:hypothetical protein